MAKRINLGFVGCGGHAVFHADVVAKMPDMFNVVAAVDTNKDRAQTFLDKYAWQGVATDKVSNLSSRLVGGDGLDAAVICTPHNSHLELSQTMVNAGVHVLCEKPLWEGIFDYEGRKVISDAKDRGLVFSSCHPRRFEPEYLYIKDNLPDFLYLYGSLVEIRFEFFYHEPSTSWKMEDSLLLDHMNHEIDLVRFLVGPSPAKFWRLSQSHDRYQVAGRTAYGLAIWFSGYRQLGTRVFRNELELVFARGHVRVESVLNSRTGMVASQVSSLSFEDGYEPPVLSFPERRYDTSLSAIMYNFGAAILGEEPCYISPEDLIVNSMICNQLRENEQASIP